MLGIMPDTKEALTKIQNSGKKVIVYTSRPWTEYVDIEEFMNENKLPFDKIICGKLLVEVMIDDRAIHFESWKKILGEQLWKD